MCVESGGWVRRGVPGTGAHAAIWGWLAGAGIREPGLTRRTGWRAGAGFREPGGRTRRTGWRTGAVVSGDYEGADLWVWDIVWMLEKHELLQHPCGIRQRPTLPGRLQPSTISAWRLNCCVRYGNRWDPPAIATGNCITFSGDASCIRGRWACTLGLIGFALADPLLSAFSG